MTKIDLTNDLKKQKGAKVVYLTVYANSPYYGFLDSGEMSTGISFVRKTKKGIYRHRSGITRWYFGDSTTLTKAVAKIRKRYGLKISPKGWEKIKVKAYNLSSVGEIVGLFNSKGFVI